jgi:hypothetical protein
MKHLMIIMMMAVAMMFCSNVYAVDPYVKLVNDLVDNKTIVHISSDKCYVNEIVWNTFDKEIKKAVIKGCALNNESDSSEVYSIQTGKKLGEYGWLGSRIY